MSNIKKKNSENKSLKTRDFIEKDILKNIKKINMKEKNDLLEKNLEKKDVSEKKSIKKIDLEKIGINDKIKDFEKNLLNSQNDKKQKESQVNKTAKSNVLNKNTSSKKNNIKTSKELENDLILNMKRIEIKELDKKVDKFSKNNSKSNEIDKKVVKKIELEKIDLERFNLNNGEINKINNKDFKEEIFSEKVLKNKLELENDLSNNFKNIEKSSVGNKSQFDFKKDLSNNNVKIDLVEESNLGPSEVKLIEDSFKIIKNLNTEVSKVQKIKEKLEKDVFELGNKIDKHNVEVPYDHSRFILGIKEELVREFMPILDKFNFKSVKVDIFKEIADIIELEIKKLRSEMESRTTKNKKEIVKKFSELEARLVDVLMNSENIRKDLKNFEKNNIIKLEKELHMSMEKAIDTVSKQLHDMFTSNSKTLILLKEELETEVLKFKNFEKDLFSLKKRLDSFTKDDLVNFSSLEAKINKMELDFSSIKSLIEKYENDLYKIENNLDLKFTEQIKENSKIFDKRLIELEGMIRGKDLSFNKEVFEFRKDFEDMKKQLESFEKEDSNYINTELSNLKEIITQEKEITQDFIVEKYNKIVDKFNELDLKFKNSFEEKTIELNDTILDNFQKKSDEIKEEISKQIISSSDFLIRLKTQNAVDKRNFFEDIENKYISIKNELEKEFAEQVNVFNDELKNKESEFLNKLIVIEDEKNHMLRELEDFKSNIAELNKNYTNQIDDEFKLLKKEEFDFEIKKDLFDKQLDFIIKVKKEEIIDQAEILKNNLFEIISEKKNKFERNENTFRELFLEKISNLHEYQRKRLDSMEKKFLEINLDKIYSKLNIELEKVELTGQIIESKSLELESRVSQIDERDANFHLEFEHERDKLKNLIEKNIEDLNIRKEKLENSLYENLNRLKLELETKFGNFEIDADLVLSDLNLKKELFEQNFNDGLETIKLEVESKLGEFEINFDMALSELDLKKDSFEQFLNDNFDLLKTKIKSDLENINQKKFQLETEVLELSNTLKSDVNKKLEDLDIKKIKLESDLIEVSNTLKSQIDDKLNHFDLTKIKLETDVLELSNTLKAQIEDKLNHFDLTKIKLETDVLELSNTLKSDIEAKSTDLELTKENLQKDVLKNSEVLKSNIDSKLNDLEVTFNTRMDQGFSDLNVKKHELEIDILETLENIKGEILEKEELFQNNINNKLEIGFDELNKKKESMEKHLLNTELKSKEKVELRLTELEKNLNKRFLDFDSMFTSFKSVVIDEVEDLMKEVTKLVANKESEMNTIITQSKFMLNELKTKGFDISKIHELVDNQIKDLRDNFEDIKVRQEIFSSPREYSLNEYVSNMQKYEKQVNALIINLRGRGFNDSQILDALSSKGHPKFLVMMILENFSHVYN